MRIEQPWIPAVIDHPPRVVFPVVLLQRLQHPATRRNDHVGSCEPACNNSAVSVNPRTALRFVTMHGHPPTDDVAVPHHYLRHIDWQRSVGILAEVQQIRLLLFDDSKQVIRRRFQVVLSVLHPFQAKCCGIEIYGAQRVQPLGLLGGRDFPKAHQRDPNSTLR